MKTNQKTAIVAIITAIVIALLSIGCNHRTNNNTTVATEDSTNNSTNNNTSIATEDSASTIFYHIIMNNDGAEEDSVLFPAMIKNVDFIVIKTDVDCYDDIRFDIDIKFDIDTVHDINKDGFSDLVIIIYQDTQSYHKYCAVYFGDKFAHYNLHDYYDLGFNYIYMRGEHYVDIEIDDQGVLHFKEHEACIYNIEGECYGGEVYCTILARYQNGDFYVIGEDYEESSSYHVTRNYLTFKEKDELTGKVKELKHAPLKKLSEKFGHKKH